MPLLSDACAPPVCGTSGTPRSTARCVGQFGWDAAGGAGDVDPDTITYQGRQACVLEVRDARGRAIPRAYVWDVTGDRPLPMNNENC